MQLEINPGYKNYDLQRCCGWRRLTHEILRNWVNLYTPLVNSKVVRHFFFILQETMWPKGFFLNRIFAEYVNSKIPGTAFYVLRLTLFIKNVNVYFFYIFVNLNDCTLFPYVYVTVFFKRFLFLRFICLRFFTLLYFFTFL